MSALRTSVNSEDCPVEWLDVCAMDVCSMPTDAYSAISRAKIFRETPGDAAFQSRAQSPDSTFRRPLVGRFESVPLVLSIPEPGEER
jgi:hypothetical protein